MHNSWNFLQRTTKEENEAISSVLKHLVGANKKDICGNLSELGITQQSYESLLRSIQRELKAPVNKTDLSLDSYVLAQLLKYVLENHPELKRMFCEQENFISVDSFSTEFDAKLHHSRIFVMKLPTYALLFSGAINPDNLKKVRAGLATGSLVTASTLAVLRSGMVGKALISGILAIPMIGLPLGVFTVAGLMAGITGLNKFFSDSDPVDLKRKWPLYLVLIQIHASHSRQFQTIDEAKMFIQNMIASIKDDNSKNKPFGVRNWSDSRLAFLRFLLKEGKDSLHISRNVLWKKEFLSLASKCSLTQHVPDHILRKLLDIPNMERREVVIELIDFIYGMRVSNFERSYFELTHQFLQTHPVGDHRCLLMDFCFPFTKIIPSVVFYVPKGKDNACDHLLTRIYLDIHGYPVSEYFTDDIDSSSFDYILSMRDRGTSMDPYLSETGRCFNADSLKKESIHQAISTQLSAREKDRKIKVLEEQVRSLKKQLDDKNTFFRRFHHDLGNMFPHIVAPLYTKKEFPEYTITDEDVARSLKHAESFLESWHRLPTYQQYGPEEPVCARELMDILHEEIGKRWTLRDQSKLDDMNVLMNLKDFLKVATNLVQNFERHAFCYRTAESDTTVTIWSEIVDDEWRLYVGNNGEPYAGDIDKFFEHKLDTTKGLGVYSMRACMRHFEGDLKVSQETDNTITYIFSFKIV